MKTSIGIITYGQSTARYLPDFLASIKQQTAGDFSLLVYDNTDDGSTANQDLLEKSGLEYRLFSGGKNLGFAKAYNILIKQAAESGSDNFLALNPDMIFEPTMLENLKSALFRNQNAGAIAPKILKWDFANQRKTNIIDSLGITSDKYFRFFDDGQGKADSLNQDTKSILGFTGAAVLFRLKALESVKFNDEYFDESMFMYKEDCDLSLRLRLAGWEILLEPRAIAYHDRTAADIGQSVRKIAAGRKHKSRAVKKWSFLNQLILLSKFSCLLDRRILVCGWIYEILSIGYALVFEPYLIGELYAFVKIRKLVKAKSQAMPLTIDPLSLNRFFLKK